VERARKRGEEEKKVMEKLSQGITRHNTLSNEEVESPWTSVSLFIHHCP
jgi:hypothetical protein